MQSVDRLGYRPALDGMRAIAIAPVVLLHAYSVPREGNLGVDIFFVLSGFLITTLLLEEFAARGTISLRAFYRRRAARLVPGLATLLIVCFAVSSATRSWTLIFAATYTTNIAMVINLHAVALPFTHLFSLAEEEQFYLLWPPLLLLVARVRPRLLTRVVALLVAAVFIERLLLVARGAGLYRIYLGPDTHAEPILIGCLFATLAHRWRPSIAACRVAFVFVVGAFFVAQWTPLLTPIAPFRTLFFIACGVAVAGVAAHEAPIRVLMRAPFVFLGQISYSLYLWHLPILAAAGAIAAQRSGLVTGGAVAASVAAATASFYLVERPLRRRWRAAPAPRTARVSAPTPAT